ncbi:quinoprotein [Izhakiella australiensis]|uniref:Quinoprotein n=1 Tax=Izhakiella australiensis TaxID=1926881 RepID=A0A1S8YN62_9GAMM|nr:membrane-bound PQQ-dependent dehydrogenase, glucose/quinate/shikimate family [Izhakiella australiensis]OON40362.1 quinoprotein [Izhakiella australiensis]
MVNKITSVVIAIVAIALLWMGVELLQAGGTPVYAILGLGTLITAILLFFNKKSALSLYAVVMWITLFWIIQEVGFDKWQWIPRGDLFGLIGLWLAMPWVVRGVYKTQVRRFHPFLGGTVIIMIAMVVALSFYDPYPKAGTITNQRENSDALPAAGDDWTDYGGTPDGQRFSTLKQINRGNVKNLEVAWTYNTGDLRDQQKDATEYTFEATPLKVNDTVYICTPHAEVHALDPQSGKLKWKYNPAKDPSYMQQHQTCRGVSYFDADGQQSGEGEQPQASATPAAPTDCRKRIFEATPDARLVALDADSGQLCASFGNQGVIDLKTNMGKVRPHALMQTAAPLVAGGLVIVGGSVMDNGYDHGNPSGVIRAYDAISGKLVWNFDPGQPDRTQPVDAGHVYTQDTPTAWTTLSADVKNGLVFVPFGNASPDIIGTRRDAQSNSEKFRDALVALDLKTGSFKWRFQSSYHDLWDRDNPSQPSLLDIDYQGSKQPVVILPTKTGNLFVLNRLTGQSVYPVNNVQVSTEGGIPGEKFSPIQPVSNLNFIPEPLTEKSMWGISPFDQMACRIRFTSSRYDGNPWTPPTEKGSVIFPGNIGVFNWGSVAVDPQRQILIATPIRIAHYYNLLKRNESDESQRLVSKDGTGVWNENFDGTYAISIKQFASSLGIPCVAPPWGRMVGVDLKTGKTQWMRRIGTTKNLKTTFLPGRFPLPFPMGMLAHGGPLITAGDLVFDGATADNAFRAYDINTGELLWQSDLPAGGQATPSTYIGKDGNQYVIIAAGGHGSLGTTPGDALVAYRLKK